MLQINSPASELLKKRGPARSRGRITIRVNEDGKSCDIGGFIVLSSLRRASGCETRGCATASLMVRQLRRIGSVLDPIVHGATDMTDI